MVLSRTKLEIKSGLNVCQSRLAILIYTIDRGRYIRPPVRTWQSQRSNGMRIDVIRYEPHTSSVGPFKIFSQQLHCFVQV